jgi:phosphoglycerol transferase MdoB-like AlkP superfamily enzyme
MKELDEYFALQQAIYDHFGYKDVWNVYSFNYSLNDAREMWWSISDHDVYWSKNKEDHRKLIMRVMISRET